MKIMQLVGFLVLASFFPGFVKESFGEDNQPATEQRSPISTDRPSFTTDSNMMSRGESQLELGYTFMNFEMGDSSTFPEVLFRYGLDENWELRLGFDGYTFIDEDDGVANNASVGFKWKFKDSGESFLLDQLTNVDMALITTLTLPTSLGATDVDPEFLLGWNYQLSDDMSLAGNIGVRLPIDAMSGDRWSQGIASIMCSKSMNDETSIFGEFYTNFPAADNVDDAEYVIQGGLIHRLSDDMQLDFRFGAGLNDESPDWLVGFGLSYRF